MKRSRSRLLLLVCAARLVAGPATHGVAWGRLKRCDMLGAYDTPIFARGTPKFGPRSDYTDGRWVPSSSARPSIAEIQPVACETHDACTGGSCSTGDDATTAVCKAYHDTCFADRRSPTFVQRTHNLAWTWEPSNGCHFSPLAAVRNHHEWHDWARVVEASAGPMLWVGDGHLAALYNAFRSLTVGGTTTDFIRADTLVNSWTLAPMTPAQITACETSSGASSGDANVPCPPAARSSTLWWEDNTHHQLHNMKWVEALHARAASLKTLVISVGAEWWQQYNYPSSAPSCHNDAAGVGLATAHLPMTSLSNVNHVHESLWRSCDVFEVKYHAMAANVATYISSVSAFKGKVIFVTSPNGVKACDASTAPVGASTTATPSEAARVESDVTKRAFWFWGNPQGGVLSPKAKPPERHTFGTLRTAEHAWSSAFQKYARRLKLATLNITVLSDGRMDAFAPGSECAYYCFPGVPHHWAEMLLRMLEQQVYGVDGLGSAYL